MRVAVVDLGSNSTRLLIADVEDGRVRELDRRSQVTRLGQGVDAHGVLAPEAVARVMDTLRAYRAAIDAAGVTATTAIMTSAVRDAADGTRFAERVAAEWGLRGRIVDGDTEAQLTFRGATSERGDRDRGRPLLVVDIGGGSTELVVGVPGGPVGFHVSTQAGVVRQTERWLPGDPPPPRELHALATDVEQIVTSAVPADVRSGTTRAVAVAGTATSCAAIDQALDPYDPARVHGYVLALGTLELMLARLAQMPLAERRTVVGLHPDRAPTIVAGIAILIEVLQAFGLDAVEVSEHDLLRGAALELASGDATNPVF